MGYFHMADLVDFKSKMLSRKDYEIYFKENGSFKNRLMRWMKSNVRRKRAFKGLEEILSSYPFINVELAAKNASSFPVIEL